MNSINIIKTYQLNPIAELVTNVREGGCVKTAAITRITPPVKIDSGTGVKIDVLA